MKLEGKVAIVTGAGSGIGRAIALAYAAEGASLVLAGRTRETIDKVAREIEALGAKGLAVPTDVSRAQDVDRMVRKACSHFGQIDILVNSAGVFVYKKLTELSADEWDETIDTNLKGIFLCCKSVLREMMPRRQGNIINISSIHGKVADANLAAHCASKFGVIGLTQSLAKEVIGFNINVNVICPGQVHSQWIEDSASQPRLPVKLRPQDVARVAVFLASLDSAIMTGSVVDVFGGTTVRIH
ncbi:MAG: SDR family NAD(P)-dependent oxidoreductase [Acidobacteriota bacterium]